MFSEEVNGYQMPPLQLPWQSYRASNFPDPDRDKRDWDELVAVSQVGEGLDLAPCGWLDALRGRNVNWFGEGLYPLSRRLGRHVDDLPPLGRAGLLDLWRYAGFCL